MNRNKLILIATSLFFLASNQAFALDFLGKSDKAETENAETQKLTLDKVDQNNFSGMAILQILNKVTAKTSDLRIKIGGQAEYGKLIIKVKKCWRAPPDQRPENKILLDIEDLQEDGTKKLIFTGWMFSSSPSVSGLEHPIYDLVAIECKN